MDLSLYAFVIAVVLLAGTTQTVTGFGFALIAAPLLVAVLEPEEVIIVSAILAMANALLVTQRVWQEVPWPTVGVLIAGSAVGMPFGLAVLILTPDDALRIAVAVASIVMAVALVAGVRFGVRGRRGELAAGAVSGVLNTSTGMNGPPVVLYLTDQRLTPSAFRGTLSAYFFSANVITLAMFAAADLFTWQPVLLAMAALPALLPASILGHALLGRLSDGAFRYLALGVLVSAALTGLALTLGRLLS
jgi:uncharacterized membrane protein YfcA